VRDPEAPEQVGPVALAGEAHVGRDGQVRKQAVILRQVADAPALGAEVNSPLSLEPDLVAKRDPPGARTVQTGDGPQQRCLAGTGWPDDRDRLGAERQGRAKLEPSAR